MLLCLPTLAWAAAAPLAGIGGQDTGLPASVRDAATRQVDRIHRSTVLDAGLGRERVAMIMIHQEGLSGESSRRLLPERSQVFLLSSAVPVILIRASAQMGSAGAGLPEKLTSWRSSSPRDRPALTSAPGRPPAKDERVGGTARVPLPEPVS
jgi:hypothetical protein